MLEIYLQNLEAKITKLENENKMSEQRIKELRASITHKQNTDFMSVGSIQELLALKKEKENLLTKIDSIQKVMASFQNENIKLKI